MLGAQQPAASKIPPAPSLSETKQEVARKQKEHKQKSQQAAVPAATDNMRDVIILLNSVGKKEIKDPKTGELLVTISSPEVDRAGVITKMLALALCEKCAPIIASSSLFRIFLQEKLLYKTEPFNEMSLDGWDIYENRTHDLYCFVPQYTISLVPYTVDELKKEEIRTGLKLTALKQADEKQRKAWEEDVSSIHKNDDVVVDNVTALFVQGIDEGAKLWNLMLSGHGLAPLGSDFSTKVGGEIAVMTALIAGISVSQYKDLIKFFTEKIRVNFLYYWTCFGGDYNLLLAYIPTLIYKEGREVLRSSKQPNFTIVSGAVSSQSVMGRLGVNLEACSRGYTAMEKKRILANAGEKTVLNYCTFFNLLHTYALRAERAVIYNDQELQAILKPVTSRSTLPGDPYGITSLPQVMFPGTEMFRAVALDDSIVVLSDVLAKVRTLEGNKPLRLDNKQALLIYPRLIPFELDIKTGVNQALSIVSMQPGLGIHAFTQISINMGYEAFVAEAFSATMTAFSKIFYVQKLQSTAGRVLHNVFIRQQKESIYTIYTDDRGIVWEQIFDKKPEPRNQGWQTLPRTVVRRTEISAVQAIPENPYLNAVFNYFYAFDTDPFKDTFGFVAREKHLLNKEEKLLLAQAKKSFGATTKLTTEYPALFKNIKAADTMRLMSDELEAQSDANQKIIREKLGILNALLADPTIRSKELQSVYPQEPMLFNRAPNLKKQIDAAINSRT